MAEAAKVRRQAYVTPTTSVKTDRSKRSNTEAGLTAAQRVALAREENRIRNYKTERAVVVDDKGNVNPSGNPMVDSRGNEVTSGSNNRVRLDSRKIPENSVLTHNHPTDNVGLAGRVGSAFSGNDIRTAVRRNLREVRAVTPNYVFPQRGPLAVGSLTVTSSYESITEGTNAMPPSTLRARETC